MGRQWQRGSRPKKPRQRPVRVAASSGQAQAAGWFRSAPARRFWLGAKPVPKLAQGKGASRILREQKSAEKAPCPAVAGGPRGHKMPAGGRKPERQRKTAIMGVQPMKKGNFATAKLRSSPLVTVFHAAAQPRRLCQRQSDGKNSDKKAIFTCLPCIIM